MFDSASRCGRTAFSYAIREDRSHKILVTEVRTIFLLFQTTEFAVQFAVQFAVHKLGAICNYNIIQWLKKLGKAVRNIPREPFYPLSYSLPETRSICSIFTPVFI